MTYDQELKQFKLEYWKRKMAECNGNIIAMAKASGCHRSYVHGLVVEFGLKSATYASSEKLHFFYKGRNRYYGSQLRLPMKYPLRYEL